jgi:hypothetical protein
MQCLVGWWDELVVLVQDYPWMFGTLYYDTRWTSNHAARQFEPRPGPGNTLILIDKLPPPS